MGWGTLVEDILDDGVWKRDVKKTSRCGEAAMRLSAWSKQKVCGRPRMDMARAGLRVSCDKLKADSRVPSPGGSRRCSELPLQALDVFLLVPCIFTFLLCICTL